MQDWFAATRHAMYQPAPPVDHPMGDDTEPEFTSENINPVKLPAWQRPQSAPEISALPHKDPEHLNHMPSAPALENSNREWQPPQLQIPATFQTQIFESLGREPLPPLHSGSGNDRGVLTSSTSCEHSPEVAITTASSEVRPAVLRRESTQRGGSLAPLSPTRTDQFDIPYPVIEEVDDASVVPAAQPETVSLQPYCSSPDENSTPFMRKHRNQGYHAEEFRYGSASSCHASPGGKSVGREPHSGTAADSFPQRYTEHWVTQWLEDEKRLADGTQWTRRLARARGERPVWPPHQPGVVEKMFHAPHMAKQWVWLVISLTLVIVPLYKLYTDIGVKMTSQVRDKQLLIAEYQKRWELNLCDQSPIDLIDRCNELDRGRKGLVTDVSWTENFWAVVGSSIQQLVARSGWRSLAMGLSLLLGATLFFNLVGSLLTMCRTGFGAAGSNNLPAWVLDHPSVVGVARQDDSHRS